MDDKCHHRVLIRGKQESQSQRGCDDGSRGQSDVRKGPWAKKCRQPPEAGNVKETDSPPELLVLPTP